VTIPDSLRRPQQYKVEIAAASIGAAVQVVLTTAIALIARQDEGISMGGILLIFAIVLPWVLLISLGVLRTLRRNGRVKPVSDVETHGPVLQISEQLGITTASALQLQGSRLEPQQCVARTKRKLHFMGVLASKWVLDPPTRADFSRLLRRLDHIGGEVKFLVIDPNSDAFTRLQALRGGHISTDSIRWLRSLAAEHPSFEVRMYTSLPTFRIVAIDDEVVTFSAYHMNESDYARSRYGWESPHAVLDPKAPWPLANAFELLFSETWAMAMPIVKNSQSVESE
jgi:hypothetical protein